MKKIYIVAGCNGAGKTTASFTIFPEILDCQEFVNADEIARGLSPFRPESVAFEAGRIMLHRLSQLAQQGTDFAFETTLSTRSYFHKISAWQSIGYHVTLLFFWLRSPNLAIQRVQKRVDEGGHNIPSETIIRRYKKGINNLFELFMPICDKTIIFDSSSNNIQVVAETTQVSDIQVFNIITWEKINEIYENERKL